MLPLILVTCNFSAILLDLCLYMFIRGIYVYPCCMAHSYFIDPNITTLILLSICIHCISSISFRIRYVLSASTITFHSSSYTAIHRYYYSRVLFERFLFD